jgi:hypothetical protein
MTTGEIRSYVTLRAAGWLDVSARRTRVTIEKA